MCVLAVLGSEGVVVKCTAAIFFGTADCLNPIQTGGGRLLKLCNFVTVIASATKFWDFF